MEALDSAGDLHYSRTFARNKRIWTNSHFTLCCFTVGSDLMVFICIITFLKTKHHPVHLFLVLVLCIFFLLLFQVFLHFYYNFSFEPHIFWNSVFKIPTYENFLLFCYWLLNYIVFKACDGCDAYFWKFVEMCFLT